jgi:hypothetical protein
MRVINSLQGVVALQYSQDDTMPERTVLIRDLLSFVGNAYKFSTRPQPPPTPVVDPIFSFQSGELILGDRKLAITSITLAVGGTIVAARDTDEADIILDDLVTKLDTELGYRIRDNVKRRDYQSNIVVQFDPSLEYQISALLRAEHILNQEIPRPNAPFKTKRLAFGFSDPLRPMIMRPFSLDDIFNSDFVIERRVGEPYEDNRYLCAAPLRTSEHARVLELVEKGSRG